MVKLRGLYQPKREDDFHFGVAIYPQICAILNIFSQIVHQEKGLLKNLNTRNTFTKPSKCSTIHFCSILVALKFDLILLARKKS